MNRNVATFSAFAVFLLSGMVYGQQQTVSFTAIGPAVSGGGLLIIPSIPNGFVMTDIYVGQNGPASPRFVLWEFENAAFARDAFRHRLDVSIFETHLNSGIPLVAGRELFVGFEGTPFTEVIATVSGYIASGSGTVPAVSSWGLGVMLLALLACGTLVMRRRPLSAT